MREALHKAKFQPTRTSHEVRDTPTTASQCPTRSFNPRAPLTRYATMRLKRRCGRSSRVSTHAHLSRGTRPGRDPPPPTLTTFQPTRTSHEVRDRRGLQSGPRAETVSTHAHLSRGTRRHANNSKPLHRFCGALREPWMAASPRAGPLRRMKRFVSCHQALAWNANPPGPAGSLRVRAAKMIGGAARTPAATLTCASTCSCRTSSRSDPPPPRPCGCARPSRG